MTAHRSPSHVALALTVAALAITPALRAQTPGPSAPAASPAREPTSFRDAFLLARDAFAAGDHARVRHVLRGALGFAPDHGLALYHLARAESMTGDAEAALRTLERLAAQGAVRDAAADSAFMSLRTGATAARFDDVARRLRAAAAPIVRADTAFALADPDFIPEGIAYDAASDAFLVGSLRGLGVLRVARDGTASTFLSGTGTGLDQVLGLHVDAARGRLWLAAVVRDTAAPRYGDGSGGWSSLHAYDLRTGRLLGRYPAPDSSRAHLLNDVVVAPNGDAYVTDSEGNALYRLRRGARALERVFAGAADFTYPNGIALGAGARRLYVAHTEGLSAFDVGGATAGRRTRVAMPAGVSGGGIDGLHRCGAELIGVQRLIDFQQVTRFRLSPDGLRVTAVEAVERRHPAYEAATTGTLAGATFHYIANAQLPRLRPDGSVTPATRPNASVILRLPLAPACGR